MRGVLLTVGARSLKIVIQVAAVVVLARMLTPNDYGLVAMVMVVIGFAEVFRDFGLTQAAVQAPTLSRGQRDNLWWINTSIGAALMLLLFLLAPVIALWYRRPELVDLSRAMSVIFLINGMTAQYRADLTRHLRFRPLAVWEVVSPLVGLGVGIALASSGASYWALVGQQLTTATILLAGSAAVAGWVARRPRRGEPMAELMTYGWHLLGSQMLGYIGNNIDSLTIGTRFGTSAMGLYNRAFQLLMTPLGQLRGPTTTVALPVLARLTNDVEATNRYVQRGQMALGLVLVAGLGLIVGAAEPVTAIFLGSQWLAVEPILRLLAVAGAFHTLGYVAYWVYLAHGLTRMLLRYTVVTVAIKVVAVLLGSQWGLIGVATGYAIAVAIDWPLSFWWLSRKSVIRVGPLFLGGARILGITTLVAAASWITCDLSSAAGRWAQLSAAIAAAAAVYLIACLTIPPVRRDLTQVVQALRKGMRRT